MHKTGRRQAADGILLFLKKPWIPFVVFAVVLLVLHIGLPLDVNDDTYYRTSVAANGLAHMMKQHYETWSSRVILEFLGFMATGLPGFVWRIANPLIFTALMYGIAVVCGFVGHRGANILLCCLMLAYNWDILCSAGWIITSVFVMWPGAAAVFVLACLQKATLRRNAGELWVGSASGTRRFWAQAALSIPLLVIAANTEQVVVFMLLALGSCLVYGVARRVKLPPLLFVYLGICLLSLCFILLSPGGKMRTGNSIASFFSDYPMRSVFQNAELGISKTLSDLFFEVNLPFLCFFSICAWAVWRQNRRFLYTLVPLVPLGVNLIFGVFRQASFSLVPRLSFFTNALVNGGIIRVDNAWRLVSVLPFLLLCMCFGCCILSLYLALGHSRAAFWGITFFIIGFCSSAMMGFSPSIWSSGERTGLYFTLVAMGLCGILYQTVPKGRAAGALIPGAAGILAVRGAVMIIQMWA